MYTGSSVQLSKMVRKKVLVVSKPFNIAVNNVDAKKSVRYSWVLAVTELALIGTLLDHGQDVSRIHGVSWRRLPGIKSRSSAGCSSRFLFIIHCPLLSTKATIYISSKVVFQVILSPVLYQYSFEYFQNMCFHNFFKMVD